jgi:hypothetical protein
MEIQVWIHPVEGLDSNISSDNKKSTHTKQHVHEEWTGMAAVGYGLQIWELWLWRTGRGAMAAAILPETPWSRGGLSFKTSHTNLLLRSQQHRTYNYCKEVGWLSGEVTRAPVWSTFDNAQRPLGCHFRWSNATRARQFNFYRQLFLLFIREVFKVSVVLSQL